MKTLPEYLQYLRDQAIARDGADIGLPVSLAEFRDYASQAFMSARDGNEYAVFPDGDKFTMIVLDNVIVRDACSGQGHVNVIYTGATFQDVLEEVVQVMIYDNDLRGNYQSNYRD